MVPRPQLLRIATIVVLGLAGCGGDKSESGPAPAGDAAKPAATAPSGPTVTLSGTVHVTGTIPPRKTIKMSSADPQCGKQHTEPVLAEDLIAADGKLQNVFVYVKTGLEGRAFAMPASPAVLDQKGCVYIPHVMGVMANQDIEIKNSDPTLHNVHAMPKKGEFNVGMPRQNSTITRKLAAQVDVMVHFKCDVHPWMSAWVGVLPHPCFAVSDAAGNWSIQGLPPGSYTIEAWHEKLGTRSQTIAVEAGQAPTLEFTFESTGS